MAQEKETTGQYMMGDGVMANSLMLDSVATETLGMAMHNSVTNQQQVHMLNIANLAATCRQLMESSLEQIRDAEFTMVDESKALPEEGSETT